MKKIIFQAGLAFLFMLLAGAGCEKTPIDNQLDICGASDPLANLYWLRDLKTTMEEYSDVSAAEIVLYRLNKVNYFYIQKSVSSAHDFPATIYDCKGGEIFKCGGNQPINDCSAFFSEAQIIKVLWKKGHKA